jgi:hypothetical protein
MGVLEGDALGTTPATPPASPVLTVAEASRAGQPLDRVLALMRAQLQGLPVDPLIVQVSPSGGAAPDGEIEGWTEAQDPLGLEGGLNRHLQWFVSPRSSIPDPVRVYRDASAVQLLTSVDVLFAFTADTMERAARAAQIVARHVLQDQRWAEGAHLDLTSLFAPTAAPQGRGVQVAVSFTIRHTVGF